MKSTSNRKLTSYNSKSINQRPIHSLSKSRIDLEIFVEITEVILLSYWKEPVYISFAFIFMDRIIKQVPITSSIHIIIYIIIETFVIISLMTVKGRYL